MPATEDEEWEYWDSKATELRRTQVATVSASAAKWSALAASLLGVFGAVAFAGGLTTLDKLASPLDTVARVITTVAVLAAVMSIVLLALAAGGIGLARISGFNGPALKSHHAKQAASQAALLFWGRITATTTAALVVVGSLLILWFGQESPALPARYLIISDSGSACGTLIASDDGSISVDGIKLTGAVANILPVAKCPTK